MLKSVNNSYNVVLKVMLTASLVLQVYNKNIDMNNLILLNDYNSNRKSTPNQDLGQLHI